jgi:hypothetical protein
MRDHKPKLKPVKHRYASGWGAIDNFFYELKPYTMMAISIVALRSPYADTKAAKLIFFGILIYSVYIAYARLYYRGHIK